MRVTLYAEHGVDWPLWGPNGLLDEGSLPLCDETKREIRAWLYAYDGRRSEVSVWVPPAGTEGTDAEEDAWVQEGERLRALIQDELGPGYDVVLET